MLYEIRVDHNTKEVTKKKTRTNGEGTADFRRLNEYLKIHSIGTNSDDQTTSGRLKCVNLEAVL